MRKSALVRGTPHSKVKIRIVQHCAAISATAELFYCHMLLFALIVVAASSEQKLDFSRSGWYFVGFMQTKADGKTVASLSLVSPALRQLMVSP